MVKSFTMLKKLGLKQPAKQLKAEGIVNGGFDSKLAAKYLFAFHEKQKMFIKIKIQNVNTL